MGDTVPVRESDDASSIHSDSSSSLYGHTPFSEFELQVRALCKNLWPFSSNGGTIIEHLYGGSYNRIVAITIDNISSHSTVTKIPASFILRIPRNDTSGLAQQITFLRYLKSHSSLPIPDVVAFDLTSDNSIGKPFMLQHRIAGVNLHEVIECLSHQQLCALSACIARLIKDIQTIMAPIPRVISSGLEHSDPSDEPEVYHFNIDADDDTFNWKRNELRHQTALEMFQLLFQRREDAIAKSDPFDIVESWIWESLKKAGRQMDKLGCFGPNEVILCHLDLEPRNIMVKLDGDQSLTVSGILDWDDAVFGPKALSCCPPVWLWAATETYNQDGRDADVSPGDANLREYKCIFEDVVGNDFISLSYPQQYRLVRQLFCLSTTGICTNECFNELELFLEEWKSLRRSLQSTATGDVDASGSGTDSSEGTIESRADDVDDDETAGEELYSGEE
jgi:aminoglycoside phosphotransferase (APT) family kinase protein